MTGRVADSGTVRVEFCRRLGSDWRDLADVLQIESYEQARFALGEEARHIWDWLRRRRRLVDLAPGLRAIGRSDLADLVATVADRPSAGWGRRGATGRWLFVGLGLLVAGAGTVATIHLNRQTVTIDSPRNDDVIPMCSTVSGTARNLSDDQALWLVVQIPNKNNQKDKYYPDVELDIVGERWVRTGFALATKDDVDRPYWIQVYAVHRSVSGSVRSGGNVAQSGLPDGAELVAEVRVRRGAANC